MKTVRNIRMAILVLFISIFTINLQAQNHAGQQAAKGAGNGALIGALAGVVFGDGYVIEDALGGALIGGGIGAFAGALNGNATDKQIQREVDAMVKEYGENNVRGYVELLECRHNKAIAYFSVEEHSSNRNHQLTSLWLKALAEKDRRNVNGVEAMYSDLINQDSDIDDEQQAELMINQLVLSLRQERKEYGIRSCN